ncbi:autophagy protein 5 [Orobanche minor]
MYIPTGALFDLLCAEPERPWNLTIHFRGYPGNLLPPCEGEDSLKWSFINALKEAAYVINANCKNIMNMSQSDQTELWRSVLDGAELSSLMCLPTRKLEAYLRVSSKLKLDIVGDDYSFKLHSSTSNSRQSSTDSDASGTTRTGEKIIESVLNDDNDSQPDDSGVTPNVSSKEPFQGGRIPVRLYVRTIDKDIDELGDAPIVESWEKISYLNHPVEVHDEGRCFTLHDAIKALLPEMFTKESSVNVNTCGAEGKGVESSDVGIFERNEGSGEAQTEHVGLLSTSADIKIVRIQGIEPKLEIPFGWVVNNLMNPEHYLHVCGNYAFPVVQKCT